MDSLTGKSFIFIFVFLILNNFAFAEGLVVNPDGNVGIGTESPSSLLHAVKPVNVVGVITAENTATTAGKPYFLAKGYTPGIGFLEVDGNPDENFHFRLSNGNLYIGTNKNSFSLFTPKITFKQNGNMGISTVAPSYKLDVNGTARVTNLLQSSDMHLKKDIQTAANSLEKISQLRGVSFKWNHLAHENEKPTITSFGEDVTFSVEAPDEREHFGLIAQEIENVFPEMVYTDENGMKSIAYFQLISPMIESIKDLNREKNLLKHEVKNLRSRLQSLETIVYELKKIN